MRIFFANWDAIERSSKAHFHFSIMMWQLFLRLHHSLWHFDCNDGQWRIRKVTSSIVVLQHWIFNQPHSFFSKQRMQFSKLHRFCAQRGSKSIIFFSIPPFMLLDLCAFCLSDFPIERRVASCAKRAKLSKSLSPKTELPLQLHLGWCY